MLEYQLMLKNLNQIIMGIYSNLGVHFSLKIYGLSLWSTPAFLNLSYYVFNKTFFPNLHTSKIFIENIALSRHF